MMEPAGLSVFYENHGADADTVLARAYAAGEVADLLAAATATTLNTFLRGRLSRPFDPEDICSGLSLWRNRPRNRIVPVQIDAWLFLRPDPWDILRENIEVFRLKYAGDLPEALARLDNKLVTDAHITAVRSTLWFGGGAGEYADVPYTLELDPLTGRVLGGQGGSAYKVGAPLPDITSAG
jgi:hypothetical protein